MTIQNVHIFKAIDVLRCLSYAVREGSLEFVLQTISCLLFALTLRGPSGGHCVELHLSSSSSILLAR